MEPHQRRLRCDVLCLSLIFALAVAAPRVHAAVLEYSVILSATGVSVQRTPEGDRVTLSDVGFVVPTDAGLPEIPYRVVSMLLPPGTRVGGVDCDASVSVAVRTSVNLRTVPAAVSADGSRGEGVSLAAWDGGVFPSERVRYLGTGYLRGYAIASFAVYPVRVENGALTVSERMTLRVSVSDAGPEMRVATRQRFDARRAAGTRERVRALVVNPGDADAYTPAPVRSGGPRGFRPTDYPSLEGSPVDYVIVTNDSLAGMFQVLADWKTAKGVPTVVRTTEWIADNYPNGVDLAETIRNFVIDAYQYWGIDYLLLGGDTGQVPTRLGASKYFGSKDLPADMYFGCLDGDWNADHDGLFGEQFAVDQTDLYQDVYVGRLPATSGLVASTLVSKVISYETPVNTSYTGKVLLLAEVLFPVDWSEGQSVTQDGAGIAETLRLLALTDPAIPLTRMYQNYTYYPGVLQESAAAAMDSIQAGYDQINQIGHGFRFNMSVGDGNIVNADADALVNPDRYTNLYMLTCTGAAITYFCLAEHYLVNPNGGAVSVIGANESAFPALSQPYMNSYYDLLYNGGVTHIGEVFARSRESRTPIAESGDNGDLWTHYIYTMLADPEMPLWTRPVQPLNASYPVAVGLGTTPVTVTVDDGIGVMAGARVCLAKGDDDYEVGYTDGTGKVTLNMTAESAGAISVVVTAPNRITHTGTIAVGAGAGAYVSLAGTEVHDDSTATTSGNGDGVMDAGEVVGMVASIRNTGTVAAQNVTLALRTSLAGVVVEDSLATVGTIPAGSTVLAVDTFRVRVDATLADEVPVPFTLEVRSGGVPTWSDYFTRLVHAPDLSFVVLRAEDSLTGNGDGVVDAGETFRLYYQVKNFGTGAAYGLTASLTDMDSAFTFTDSTDTYPELAPIVSAENTNGFLISETSTAAPHTLRLDISNEYGQQWSRQFELRAPLPPTVVTFDPSRGADRLQLGWDASASGDVAAYRVRVSAVAGGPYSIATTDPVEHCTFLASGLSPTTRYYVRVSAIDQSGNESALSAEFSGSTNPKQVEGWPIAMLAETVSSPVVGDIDGDQQFEIVVGDSKVYAWHPNGVEMHDADLNPQTWGLFSTLGSSFVAPIALADMDPNPGMEILAASRDTKQVIVFNYSGNPIAGWPQPVLNAIRAGVVAADIDGNGSKEVLAIDEKGVLYAWNADGTERRNGDHNPATNGVFRTFGGCAYQYTCPAVGDIDGDGVNEIVVGTQGDSLFVMHGDGSALPGWPKAFSSDIAGNPALGDIDGDMDLDIVVNEWSGWVWALRGDGSVIWSTWFKNQLSFSPSPALGDLDGDGRLEVVLPSANRSLYAIRYDGANLPGWPVIYASQLYTESSPIIADIDNDGSLDVVLGDETKYLNAWDASGAKKPGFPLALADAVRATPLIADVDKDGSTDLVAAGWDKYVYVWDFPSMFNPLKAPWARYHGNLFNDGNVTTPLPTPVGTATFRFDARARGGVELVWTVAAGVESGYLQVSRAEVTGGEPGVFRRVADGLFADATGEVRVVDTGVEEGGRYVYRLEGAGGVLSETREVVVPVQRAKLGQNYPNPFNPVTHIEYWVPGGAVRSRVRVVVYDVRGARVRTLVDGDRATGRYSVAWDGRNDSGTPVGTGVYLYRMTAGSFQDTRKMVLLK